MTNWQHPKKVSMVGFCTYVCIAHYSLEDISNAKMLHATITTIPFAGTLSRKKINWRNFNSENTAGGCFVWFTAWTERTSITWKSLLDGYKALWNFTDPAWLGTSLRVLHIVKQRPARNDQQLNNSATYLLASGLLQVSPKLNCGLERSLCSWN